MVLNLEINIEKMSLDQLKEAKEKTEIFLTSLSHYIHTCEKAKKISTNN